MNVSIAERLADRLGRKLAKRTPFRSDFVVADYRVLDDHKSAKILIQYDEDTFGIPSKEDVVGSMMHLYRAQNDSRPRIVVNPTSVKIYPNLQAVACVVELPSIRRPYADVKRFKMKEIVAGTVFLGVDVTDTWAVAKGDNDAIYIERIEKDDIDQIIRERSRVNAFRAHATTGRGAVTLARVEAMTGNNAYSQGDKVKVSANGKLRSGEILGMTDSGAHVRFDNGSQSLVPFASLHGIIAADAAETWNKEALKEYYRKAYGYDEADLEKLVSYLP